jgi:hypothetical protein
MATLDGSSVEGSTVYNSEKGRFVTLTGSGIVAGVAGSVITTYYKKMARDSGSVSPQYVTWVVTDPSTSYPDPPPSGGPLVDETIVSIWEVYT